jgi:HNH endonuclease
MHSRHIFGPLEARFWAKVDKGGHDECWKWKGAKLPKGYGKINDGTGRTISAHRVSWFLARGEYPVQHVLHRCDNPACVNPSHLFLGTIADNNADMLAKGRKFSKLTQRQVAEIRKRLPSATTQSLADEFGVSQSLISHIKHGRAWLRR